MSSIKFIKRISRVVSSSSLKEMNEIMLKEANVFKLFLSSNEILIDDFIDHVFEAYSEGGLVASS